MNTPSHTSPPAPRPFGVHQQHLLRWGLILALPLVIVAVAFIAPSRLAVMLLAGLLGLTLAAILLRWPTAGLVLLIPAALLAPIAIGTGSESSINAPMLLLMLLTALWLFDMVALRRQIDIHLSRPLLALAALAAVTVLAFLVGQLPWFPLARPAPMRAQIGGVMIFVLSLAAFALAAHQIKTQRALQAMTGLFLGLGAIFAVGQIGRAHV